MLGCVVLLAGSGDARLLGAPENGGVQVAVLSPAPAGPGPSPRVEVLRAAGVVRAVRVGHVVASGRISWLVPDGDVVALDGSWWSLAEPIEPEPTVRPAPDLLTRLGVSGDDAVALDAVLGDVDDDGAAEAVVVFVRPARPTLVSDALAVPAPTDDRGRTLHVGVYSVPGDGGDEAGDPAGNGARDPAADSGQVPAQQWVAGTVLRPVSTVAACDGTLALGYSSAVGATDRVSVGVVAWRGFGFVSAPGLPDLPGDGVPACGDVDGDGRSDPLVLGRSAS